MEANPPGPFTWNVSLMQWSAYKRALLFQKGKEWDRLMEAELVIGGLFFTVDFLYISCALQQLSYTQKQKEMTDTRSQRRMCLAGSRAS